MGDCPYLLFIMGYNSDSVEIIDVEEVKNNHPCMRYDLVVLQGCNSGANQNTYGWQQAFNAKCCVASRIKSNSYKFALWDWFFWLSIFNQYSAKESAKIAEEKTNNILGKGSIEMYVEGNITLTNLLFD